jgi:hypothetical protein
MQSASFTTSTFNPEPPSVCGRRPSITRRTDSPVCSPLAISWNRPGGSDLTFAELVQRVQAKYRRLGIDHPTPLVEGTDSRELVLWARPGAARRTPVLLNRAQSGALTVTAGRLHGLVENSVLAVYPPPGKGGAGKDLLGHVVVTRARPTESDRAAWDEAKAPDFQTKRFTAPAQPFEGGERCEVVMASYGDLKLRVAAAPAGDDGKPLDPASVRRVQEQLTGLGERAKQFVDVAEPPVAQWLVREAAKPAAGKELELFRREGMATGPLAVPGGADKLGPRLIEIARAQMLITLETGDAPPAEDKVKAGEAVAFDIELLRQAGGNGEFKTVSLASGAGPVLQVSDRVQLWFTNRGKIPVDVTVLQIDQNYDINQFFPQGGRHRDEPRGSAGSNPRAGQGAVHLATESPAGRRHRTEGPERCPAGSPPLCGDRCQGRG